MSANESELGKVILLAHNRSVKRISISEADAVFCAF